jgi:hypothetical protein
MPCTWRGLLWVLPVQNASPNACLFGPCLSILDVDMTFLLSNNIGALCRLWPLQRVYRHRRCWANEWKCFVRRVRENDNGRVGFLERGNGLKALRDSMMIGNKVQSVNPVTLFLHYLSMCTPSNSLGRC